MVAVAVVPESATKLVGSQNLKYKKINSSALETRITAIWVKNRYLSSAAREFLDTFKNSSSM
jgi:DNA-binding transcriptional LysR family regulator